MKAGMDERDSDGDGEGREGGRDGRKDGEVERDGEGRERNPCSVCNHSMWTAAVETEQHRGFFPAECRAAECRAAQAQQILSACGLVAIR